MISPCRQNDNRAFQLFFLQFHLGYLPLQLMFHFLTLQQVFQFNLVMTKFSFGLLRSFTGAGRGLRTLRLFATFANLRTCDAVSFVINILILLRIHGTSTCDVLNWLRPFFEVFVEFLISRNNAVARFERFRFHFSIIQELVIIIVS